MSEQNVIKVWVTKYALSRGIETRDATVVTTVSSAGGERSGTMIRCVRAGHMTEWLHKPFWHTSEQEAIRHAESLRVKKIESLKRQIKKLETLKFKPQEKQ